MDLKEIPLVKEKDTVSGFEEPIETFKVSEKSKESSTNYYLIIIITVIVITVWLAMIYIA